MRGARLAARGVVAAALGAAVSASAQPASLEVRIECGALDEEGRALLEARSRAEMAADSVRGALEIECAPPSPTRMTWEPEGGEPRNTSVPWRVDRAETVDALLDALHRLVLGEPDAPPRRAAPPVASTEQAPEVATAAGPSPGSPRVGALGGTEAELWAGSIPVALGGHAGALIELSESWDLTLLLGAVAGIADGTGVGAWSARAILRLDWRPVSSFQFGLGAKALSLHVTDTSATGVKGLDGATGGAVLSARYRVQVGPLHVALGPQIEVMVQPLAVQVGGAEVFRVPVVVGGLALDVSTL